MNTKKIYLESNDFKELFSIIDESLEYSNSNINKQFDYLKNKLINLKNNDNEKFIRFYNLWTIIALEINQSLSKDIKYNKNYIYTLIEKKFDKFLFLFSDDSLYDFSNWIIGKGLFFIINTMILGIEYPIKYIIDNNITDYDYESLLYAFIED